MRRIHLPRRTLPPRFFRHGACALASAQSHESLSLVVHSLVSLVQAAGRMVAGVDIPGSHRRSRLGSSMLRLAAARCSRASRCPTASKRYSRPCLPPLWPRLYAEPFGLGEKKQVAFYAASALSACSSRLFYKIIAKINFIKK